MKLSRIISVFDIKSEELVKEINIDHVSLSSLKEIFNNESNDPMLIKPMHIKRDQMIAINTFLEEKIEYNDGTYIYQLDCFQG